MNKLVTKYLFYRKKRTIASIIGIALAIILAVGIGGIIESFKLLTLDTIKASDGNWHYSLLPKGQDNNGLEYFEKISSKYDSVVGKSYINGSIDDPRQAKEDKDNIIGVYNYLDHKNGENFESMIMQYKKIEGRLPKNDDEILLSDECKSLVGLDSEITLYLFSSKNFSQTPDDTGKFGVISKTFKVVGFYDGLNKLGYTLNLDCSSINASYTTDIQIKENEKSFETTLDKILSDCNIVKNEDVLVMENSFLLQLLGQNQSGRELYGTLQGVFIGVAIFILALMGIVIKNSVAMSASDKIEQFGILRCLGATKKQIVKMVINEAILMWCMALVVGYVVSFISIKAVLMFIGNLFEGKIKFVLPIWECFVSAILSFFTILICSYFPGRHASKVSPVDAVRGVTVIKSQKIKRNKKGKILNKIFGFSGFLASKNIRRNRKRFRSTVSSITTATIMFILFSTVVIQLDNAIKRNFQADSAEFVFMGADSPSDDDVKNLFGLLKETEGVDKVSSYKGSWFTSSTGYKVGDQEVVMKCVSVSEQDYNSLEFTENRPDYKDLIDQKAGVIFQTIKKAENGKTEEIRCDYKKINDEVMCYTGNLRRKDDSIKILGEIKSIPWFLVESSYSGFYVIVPDGIFEDPDDNWMENICVKSKKNYEDKLSRYFSKELKSNSLYKKFYIDNRYEAKKTIFNVIKIFDLFMIIFIGIIVLICFVNLFNTITSNLQSRKSEIATLRSIGMSKTQLLKMLRLECILYGLIATVIGTIASIYFEILLFNSGLKESLAIKLDVGLNVIICLVSLIFTTLICLLSGHGPIKRLMKTSIIDGIRSKE